MRPNLLLVDDEPVNLEILQEYFDGQDYGLTACATAQEAWQEISRRPDHYSLVVLDRMMPGMNGMDMLRLMKAEARLARIPVIMQTAASSPEDVREGLAAGAYYYLTKPYERDSLLTIVRAALSDAAAHQDLRQRLALHDNAVRLLTEARFEFQTLEEAGSLAGFLANCSPNPEGTLLGLSELLINALEHGNLGISYQEKSRLRREDNWEQEIHRRQQLAENEQKRVRVHMRRQGPTLCYTIQDEGQGFQWQNFLDFDPSRAFDPNGRGIALARLSSFHSLEYQGSGNIVVATINLGEQ